MKWKLIKTELEFNFEEHDFISHVQLPTINNQCLYFSTRTKENKSHIARVCNGKFEIYLSPQETFDSIGCMPSCFIEDQMIYTGWTTSTHCDYSQNICLYDGNQRHCLLTPEQDDSFLVNSGFVLKENSIYRMWYVSATNWIGNKPLYKINYAESYNKLDWKILKKNIVPKLSTFESPSRPFVRKINNIYEMYFSSSDFFKKTTYELQYAYSYDGIEWKREPISIYSDENMLCYPFISNENKMLINGSDYGKNKILLFEQE